MVYLAIRCSRGVHRCFSMRDSSRRPRDSVKHGGAARAVAPPRGSMEPRMSSIAATGTSKVRPSRIAGSEPRRIRRYRASDVVLSSSAASLTRRCVGRCHAIWWAAPMRYALRDLLARSLPPCTPRTEGPISVSVRRSPRGRHRGRSSASGSSCSQPMRCHRVTHGPPPPRGRAPAAALALRGA